MVGTIALEITLFIKFSSIFNFSKQEEAAIAAAAGYNTMAIMVVPST